MDAGRTIRYRTPGQAWTVYTLKTARGSFFEIGIPMKKPRPAKAAKTLPVIDEEALRDAGAHITECAQDCGFSAAKM